MSKVPLEGTRNLKVMVLKSTWHEHDDDDDDDDA